MSFDPRSLERLQELGRRLPQPLPKPEPPAQTPSAAAPASERRHRVETETDPEALFHELMQVSPDGTVPPHLLDRLRQVEALKRPQPSGTRPFAPPAASSEVPRRKAVRPTVLGQRDPRTAAAHPELYTAFQQLLLEGDGDD
ncbi:hypothetical protein [Cyanobium sp. Morenito 9A2]|uniref:hypothetical protein n=1 Tax=Cyanobium sp. Morenito 9A2 TaxID=2823718 RepID=UPI0020CF6F44|nr:hypothetical protein [Cyanobium sp. Morenito 9A2]MCP9850490.1 hypothetical protein [Cyanobium sp. Morenito 9A2]